MGYKLTLSREEWRAVKMMADRYSGATFLYDVFMDNQTEEELNEELTVNMPESLAWGLLEAREQDMEGGHRPWPCFSPTLAEKLETFCDSIV